MSQSGNPQEAGSIVDESSEKPDAKTQVLEEAAHEYVFAVVGHAGSGTSRVASSFAELLEKQKPAFQTNILKARDVIEEWAKGKQLQVPVTGAQKSIATATMWQDRGDDMRSATKDHAAVAKALIQK